jgi:arsenite-transporting ATPase
MEIKVLGSGCSKCRVTIGMIERVARDLGVAVEITKVQNPEEIQRHGIHATPAVIIDDKIVHSGGLPSHDKIQGWLKPGPMGFLSKPTRHLFFTGKGGVGKTSLSTAAALTLADAGKKVLLVSTDAASNLDEMRGIELRNTPTPVPGAPGLSVLNIDPDTAAESYRQRVLAQMGAGASENELSTVREQLSGACTTEIASFDEFASLLSDNAEHYDHIIFDTAPTGHTLRLLSLPKAWSGARVAKLAKDTPIVIYCGCCPWSHCPNIAAAYNALRALGFTQVGVLYIADNFGDNWVNKGFPVAKGQ